MPDRIHIAESTMGPPLRTLCDSFLPVRWRPDLFVVHSRPCPLQPLHGPLVIAHHCLLNTSCVVPLFMGLLRSSIPSSALLTSTFPHQSRPNSGHKSPQKHSWITPPSGHTLSESLTLHSTSNKQYLPLHHVLRFVKCIYILI